MTISPHEAADALKDISRTGRRSASAYGNRMASPHLILWGVIWFVGYGAMHFAHGRGWSWLWPLLSLVGVIASYVVGRRMKGTRADAGSGWRYFATVLAGVLFVMSVFAILPPTRDAQVAAFFPLLVALAYVVTGIWWNALRIGLVGLAIGAATLFGFFYLTDLYLPWLAVVGGGGLVLGGFWMRRT